MFFTDFFILLIFKRFGLSLIFYTPKIYIYIYIYKYLFIYRYALHTFCCINYYYYICKVKYIYKNIYALAYEVQ